MMLTPVRIALNAMVNKVIKNTYKGKFELLKYVINIYPDKLFSEGNIEYLESDSPEIKRIKSNTKLTLSDIDKILALNLANKSEIKVVDAISIISIKRQKEFSIEVYYRDAENCKRKRVIK